jgi:sugar lactone lactonase YvrE
MGTVETIVNALRRSAACTAVVFLCNCVASAQTTPAGVPVPFTTALAGIGSTATASSCTTGYNTTDGSTLGDGCVSTLSKLNASQGAAIDRYGNVYIADYNDRAIRVVYNGNAALATAIKAANSGFTIAYGGQASRSAPAPTAVVGDIYTIAGIGDNAITPAQTYAALTVTNTDGKFACGNVAGNPDALNSLGDGCPAAAAPIGPRDVSIDTDGNLFFTDYTNSRVRVFCVNCASGTMAAALIALEQGSSVTPVNGAMYTIVGFAGGFRDAAAGYASTANVTGATAAENIALLRSPTAAIESSTDDIFIADNLNNAVRLLYNGGTVAKAILTANGITPTQGYVYTIAGAGCVSALTTKTGSVATANACLTTAPTSPATADTVTLGNVTPVNVAWTVYLDANSNVYYTDSGNNRIKVIYGGIANPLTLTGALSTGYVYSFAGQGTSLPGTVTGVAPSAIALASPQGVGGDQYGNIFFLDYTNGLIYETYAQNGMAAIIAGGAGNATPAAGAYCNNSTTGPQMTDAYYDGCPATQSKFTSARGPVVADANGNLYFGDAIGFFIRKFTYNPTFPTTTVATTAASQPYAFTLFSASTTVISISFDTAGGSAGDFSDAGSDQCTSVGNTCVYNVNFTPARPGARTGALLLNGASGVLAATSFSGIGNGAALAIDPGAAATTGTSGIPYTPNGIAVDGASRVLLTDTTSKSLVRFSGTTATTLATGFAVPAGVAVDNAGNIFVADTSANTITEVPIIGGTKYTLNASLNAPHNLATDSLGRLYVADTGNNRVAVFGPGATKTLSTVAFTGLNAPVGVAVDGAFNIYAVDSTHIVKLTPLGVQSTIATVSGVTALAVDAAGNLLVTTGTTLVEYPAATATATTLYASLVTPKSLVLDGTGNAYIADTGINGYFELQRTAAYYKFLALTGTTTIELSSIGTAAVSTTAYTQTDTTDYALVPATTNGCSGALALGTACALTATYAPTAPGILTDSVTFSAVVTNGAPTLTLTNISLTPAVTLQISPASLTYGGTETLTATVYGPSNTSGSVSFYNNLTSLITTVPVTSAGTATYSYLPTAGSYSVTASFTPTGSSTATVTSKAATYTVALATPTLTVTPSAASGYTTTAFTLTATVGSPVSTPGGSIIFYDNGVAIAPSTQLVSGSLTVPATLPVGTDCITATYSGDPNFVTLTSPCSNVSVAPGFGVVPSITALAFQLSYQEAQSNLTINPGGRTDTIAFACQGLPAKLNCTFSPSTLVLDGGSATQTVQMLVSNSNATGDFRDGPATGLFQRSRVALAALPLAALLLFGLRRRRLPLPMLIVLLSFSAATGLIGCGNGPTSLEQAPGVYPFTVTITSGTTTLQTLSFTLSIPSAYGPS